MTSYELLINNPTVPVLTVNDASRAPSLALALIKAGIFCAEITLRTSAAFDAIKRVKNACPEMTVIAGTVLTPQAARDALNAGAQAIVSPGLDIELALFCREAGVPYIPGVADATEIQAAIKLGLNVLKFFPAEASGGAKALASLAAPFNGVYFMPTGGINDKNIGKYRDLEVRYKLRRRRCCSRFAYRRRKI